MRVAASQSCEPLGGFARNERLESQAHKLCFFVNTGELACALEELIVDVECRSHMHQYALMMHPSSSLFLDDNAAG